MPVDLTTLLSAIIGQSGGKFINPLPNPLDGGRPFLPKGNRTGRSGQTGNVSFSMENNDVIKPVLSGVMGQQRREKLPGAGQDLVDDMRLIAAHMDLSDAEVETDELDRLDREGGGFFKTLDKGVRAVFNKENFLSNLPLLAAAAEFSHPFAADGVSPVSIGSKIGDAINAGLRTDATMTNTSALKTKAKHGRFQALGDKLFQIKDGKVTEVANTEKTLERLSAISKAKAEGTKAGKDELSFKITKGENAGKSITISEFAALLRAKNPKVNSNLAMLKAFGAEIPGEILEQEVSFEELAEELGIDFSGLGVSGGSTATSPTGLTATQERIRELKAKRGIQ